MSRNKKKFRFRRWLYAGPGKYMMVAILAVAITGGVLLFTKDKGDDPLPSGQTSSDSFTEEGETGSKEESPEATGNGDEMDRTTEPGSSDRGTEDEKNNTESAGSETEEVSTDEGETDESETDETEETKENQTPAEKTVLFVSSGYGEAAYSYLRYINDNFPKRTNINGGTRTANLTSCGTWIVTQMNAMGYQENVIDRIHEDASLGNSEIITYYFRKQGSSEKRIVIGAHYDCMDTKGCEDNGTGVAMVLELAKRFASENTYYTIDFCFFDGEEKRGSAGSCYYLLADANRSDIVLYFNLDCLGAGDEMYVYGGDYENDVLVRDWGYNMAKSVANRLGIALQTIPQTLVEDVFCPPTRTVGSDQYYFNYFGIPYVYLEANAWVDSQGVEQYPNGQKAFQYNSRKPCFASTNGQINHTVFDDLDKLESLIPGQIRSHLTSFSQILTTMVRELNASSESTYASNPAVIRKTEKVTAPAELSDVVFIGDSRTVSMTSGWTLAYRLLPDESVNATGGAKLYDACAVSDAQAAAQKHKGCAVFWYGVNDVQVSPERDDVGKFVSNYQAVIDAYLAINPGSKIVVLSILSTSPEEQDYYEGQESNIQAYNAAMKARCEERGYTYLDITSLFDNGSGLLGDHIHFSKEWYEEKFLPFMKNALK